MWQASSTLVSFATRFCLLDTLGADADRVAAAVGGAFLGDGGPLLAAIIAAALAVAVWRQARGRGPAAWRGLARSGLLIAVMAVMVAGASRTTMVTAPEDGSTFTDFGTGSPGWAATRVNARHRGTGVRPGEGDRRPGQRPGTGRRHRRPVVVQRLHREPARQLPGPVPVRAGEPRRVGAAGDVADVGEHRTDGVGEQPVRAGTTRTGSGCTATSWRTASTPPAGRSPTPRCPPGQPVSARAGQRQRHRPRPDARRQPRRDPGRRTGTRRRGTSAATTPPQDAAVIGWAACRWDGDWTVDPQWARVDSGGDSGGGDDYDGRRLRQPDLRRTTAAPGGPTRAPTSPPRHGLRGQPRPHQGRHRRRARGRRTSWATGTATTTPPRSRWRSRSTCPR